MGDSFDPFNDSNLSWPTQESHYQHDIPSYFSPQVEEFQESIQHRILEGSFARRDSESHQKSHETIHVVLQEQLTTMYHGSDISSESKVEGSIYARASSGGRFRLVISDHAGHLESIEENPSCCSQEIVSRIFNPSRDEFVLSGILPNNSAKKERIASYTCNNVVNPVPILVKTKIASDGVSCKIGIKVRSNPKNENILTQVSILIALPPGFCGETMNSNRPGGVWDGMKRIVAYAVDSLVPGELIEIQTQFKMIETSRFPNNNSEPKFPIIVRGECTNCQFSDIELRMDESRHNSGLVKMFLTKSVIVTLRKL
jgi:hypothetical protein